MERYTVNKLYLIVSHILCRNVYERIRKKDKKKKTKRKANTL